MKLITLNIWGGAVFNPLISFLKKHSAEIDIFCLQELWNHPNPPKDLLDAGPDDVRPEIYKDIEKILPDFNGYFASIESDVFGIGIFVRKDIVLKKEGDVFVHKAKDSMVGNDASTLGRNVQYVEFNNKGRKTTVCNFHGLWNGGKGKGDSDERIEQSKNIEKFLREINGRKILCGDFNLLPDTKSIKILEDAGMKNLIKEFDIQSTRSKFYTKPLRFADYIFVSPDVNVKDFRVLQDQISDHLPLYLEFD